MQTDLFLPPLRLPNGFRYEKDFLNPEEEQQLLGYISHIPLHPLMFQGYEAKRRVASFGMDYSFDTRKASPGKPIPVEFHDLIKKTAGFFEIAPQEFVELLITEYPVGSVINWHRDAPPFGIIAGISLQADCVFKFRPHETAKQSRGSVISVALQRRSIYCMQGEARSAWQHSTAPVKEVRYSITLRTLKQAMHPVVAHSF